jgi:hypothetical protein
VTASDDVSQCEEAGDWLVDLREKFVDAGHQPQRVEEALHETLRRFRQPRVRSFLPLLVERAVQQALQGE